MLSCYYQFRLVTSYASIDDGKHLYPFSNGQLQNAKKKDPEMYKQMRAFNQIFCSQRITIERAFGQFIRKFAIFWAPITFSNLERIPLLITACAHLYNLCVDNFLVNKFGRDELNTNPREEYPYPLPLLPSVDNRYYEKNQHLENKARRIHILHSATNNTDSAYTAESQELNDYTDADICYMLRNGYIDELPVVNNSFDMNVEKNKKNKSKLKRYEYMCRIHEAGITCIEEEDE